MQHRKIAEKISKVEAAWIKNYFKVLIMRNNCNVKKLLKEDEVLNKFYQ